MHPPRASHQQTEAVPDMSRLNSGDRPTTSRQSRPLNTDSKVIRPTTAPATSSNTFFGINLPPDVGEWSAKNVGAWVASLGFPQYSICFTGNNIHGAKLSRVEAKHFPQMGIQQWDHVKHIMAEVKILMAMAEEYRSGATVRLDNTVDNYDHQIDGEPQYYDDNEIDSEPDYDGDAAGTSENDADMEQNNYFVDNQDGAHENDVIGYENHDNVESNVDKEQDVSMRSDPNNDDNNDQQDADDIPDDDDDGDGVDDDTSHMIPMNNPSVGRPTSAARSRPTSAIKSSVEPSEAAVVEGDETQQSTEQAVTSQVDVVVEAQTLEPDERAASPQQPVMKRGPSAASRKGFAALLSAKKTGELDAVVATMPDDIDGPPANTDQGDVVVEAQTLEPGERAASPQQPVMKRGPSAASRKGFAALLSAKKTGELDAVVATMPDDIDGPPANTDQGDVVVEAQTLEPGERAASPQQPVMKRGPSAASRKGFAALLSAKKTGELDAVVATMPDDIDGPTANTDQRDGVVDTPNDAGARTVQNVEPTFDGSESSAGTLASSLISNMIESVSGVLLSPLQSPIKATSEAPSNVPQDSTLVETQENAQQSTTPGAEDAVPSTVAGVAADESILSNASEEVAEAVSDALSGVVNEAFSKAML